MADQDRTVLEFIGPHGKNPDQLRERFPDFDVERLVRAALVELRVFPIAAGETEGRGTPPAQDQRYYALTPRGAEAIGLDPALLG